MKASPADSSPRTRTVGAPFLFTGLIAVGVAFAVPLFVGSFSTAEIWAVVALEAACVLALGASALLLARRLRSTHEALWELSRRDELTGVGNYRALHERLAEEIARHSRRGREFALILIDLDGFKQVNEDFGHLEGDRLLTEIGTGLQEEVRGEDPVFRQGGDEFAVIAPETNGEEAEDVAARIRMRVRSCDTSIPVSAATGFAIFPGDGRSSAELLRRADADLFGAKRSGRAV